MDDLMDLYDLEVEHGHNTLCAWKRADYHCRAYDCTVRHDTGCTSDEHGALDDHTLHVLTPSDVVAA